MRFGVSIPPVPRPHEMARDLERLGYDYVATGEHVFFHSACTNAFVTMAACAAATERIRLVSAATLLPVYPAALAAKMALDLDRISGGRFVMGVGIGGEYPVEFEATGVPLTERGRRFDDGLAMLDYLFAGRTDGLTGRYGSLPPEVTVRPGPVSAGGPPVWVAGRGAKAQRRTAVYDAGWLPYMYSATQLGTSVQQITEIAHTTSGRKWSGEVACVIPFSVHADPAVARRNAAQWLAATYGQDMSRLIDRCTLTGDPAQIRDRLDAYAEAGLQTAILLPMCEPEEVVGAAAELLAAVSQTHHGGEK